ncbi:hypothetical protein [Dankookia sp. P2]|uniref:hypothetical protein n=1 Tax=Dankookia sp. P2 TaxID=3423955 RepID=UPI003D6798C5
MPAWRWPGWCWCCSARLPSAPGSRSSGLAAQRPPRGGVEEAIGFALLGWLAAQPFRVQREG